MRAIRAGQLPMNTLQGHTMSRPDKCGCFHEIDKLSETDNVVLMRVSNVSDNYSYKYITKWSMMHILSLILMLAVMCKTSWPRETYQRISCHHLLVCSCLINCWVWILLQIRCYTSPWNIIMKNLHKPYLFCIFVWQYFLLMLQIHFPFSKSIIC